jgi:phosphoribosylformimino-5-aminoimidazole carboxamide ribotide isomerase
VIPVLDLMDGCAVWARGGVRAAYAPVRSALAQEAGDAVALARAFRATLGCEECYVADLDAIMGRPLQHALLGWVATVGSRLLADVGAAAPTQAAHALVAGADRVIVGLETLPSFGALAAIVQAHGSDRVVFSLDLWAGQPVVRPGSPHGGGPMALVKEAVRAGVAAVIVLDLARVGSGDGADLALGAEIRRAYPGLELLVGGGIASRHDLADAAAAGYDGALVASALHDGTLDAASVQAARHLGARHEDHLSSSRYVAD